MVQGSTDMEDPVELTEKQQRYQSHIQAAETAGIPLAAYAKTQGVRVHCLYSERQRLRKQARKTLPSFVRVQDVVDPVMPAAMLQIRLPNGVNLALPSQQVPLTEILQTLAAL